MKNVTLLFSLCAIISSCSFSSPNKEDATIKPTDDLEFAVDTLEPSSTDLKVEEQKLAESKIPDEISPVERPAESIAQSTGVEAQAAEAKVEVKAEVNVEEKKITASNDGEQGVPMTPPEEPIFKDFKKPKLDAEGKYFVQKGDTLMMVAFKIYGDYRKWHDLKKWNTDKPSGKLSEGMSLKYFVPDQEFGWKPNGMPYMVKTGDTLGLISNEKYGTPRKWKSLYDNNRPLIRNPNLIFAGFTIYYLPIRNVASEHK